MNCSWLTVSHCKLRSVETIYKALRCVCRNAACRTRKHRSSDSTFERMVAQGVEWQFGLSLKGTNMTSVVFLSCKIVFDVVSQIPIIKPVQCWSSADHIKDPHSVYRNAAKLHAEAFGPGNRNVWHSSRHKVTFGSCFWKETMPGVVSLWYWVTLNVHISFSWDHKQSSTFRFMEVFLCCTPSDRPWNWAAILFRFERHRWWMLIFFTVSHCKPRSVKITYKAPRFVYENAAVLLFERSVLEQWSVW